VLEMLTLSWASVRAQPVGAFLLDAGADERVALDLAPCSDDDVALDLDERADSRLVADPAAVEIRERVDDKRPPRNRRRRSSGTAPGLRAHRPWTSAGAACPSLTKSAHQSERR